MRNPRNMKHYIISTEIFLSPGTIYHVDGIDMILLWFFVEPTFHVGSYVAICTCDENTFHTTTNLLIPRPPFFHSITMKDRKDGTKRRLFP